MSADAFVSVIGYMCSLGSLVAVECSGWEPHSRQEEGPGWLLCRGEWAQKLINLYLTQTIITP